MSQSQICWDELHNVGKSRWTDLRRVTEWYEEPIWEKIQMNSSFKNQAFRLILEFPWNRYYLKTTAEICARSLAI